MIETMHNAGGIGLAATQVGSLDRIIVVDNEALDEEARPDLPATLVLINPEVIAEHGVWSMEEGCLSIPEIREEVERVEDLHLRFKDVEFVEQELKASGLLGRVILHEIDHLNGVLFIDHLTTEKGKLLRGRLNKIARGEVEVSYPVVCSVSSEVTTR
jgi:peptide deformylase